MKLSKKQLINLMELEIERIMKGKDKNKALIGVSILKSGNGYLGWESLREIIPKYHKESPQLVKYYFELIGCKPSGFIPPID